MTRLNPASPADDPEEPSPGSNGAPAVALADANELPRGAWPKPTRPVAPPAAAAPAVPAAVGPAGAAKLDRRYVTAALMLVMVLASMEQTITSTAMPTIIGDLHGLEHYSWVASIYLLACTVSMPLYGRLADALGRKRVVIGAIGLFLVGSLLAGFSRSMPQLIASRGLQGLGAGGIMPVVLTILGDIFTLQERARIQGFFSAVWGTASLAGPQVGAMLVKGLGWQAVFFINFPLAVLGLAVLSWKYHDLEKPHSTDLDLPGAATLAGACTAVLALMSRLGPGGWSVPVCIVLAALSVVLIFAFILLERRAANPIMPPWLLTHRWIGPSLIGSMLLGVGFLSLDTYVPLYIQGGRGGDASGAARVVTPVMLTWALSGIVAAPLVLRWGFRRLAGVGSMIVLVGFVGLVLCAMLNASPWVLTGVLAITGLGFGPASMSFLLAAQNAVEWQQRGVVTSAVQFYRTIGGAVGIGVLGGMFNGLTHRDMVRLANEGATPAKLLDPKFRVTLSPEVIHAVERMICGGLLWVFIAMLLFAVAQVFVTLLIPAKKADHKISRAEPLEALGG